MLLGFFLSTKFPSQHNPCRGAAFCRILCNDVLEDSFPQGCSSHTLLGHRSTQCGMDAYGLGCIQLLLPQNHPVRVRVKVGTRNSSVSVVRILVLYLTK